MENKDPNTRLALLENNHKTMADKIDNLKETVDKGFLDLKKEFSCMREENDRKYVSKDKFEPVRAIAYGMVGIVLTAVVVGILNTLLK